MLGHHARYADAVSLPNPKVCGHDFLLPVSEGEGQPLLAPSHNSHILILYVSTNPGMMIERYQYGRYELYLQRTRSHNTFAGKGMWQLQAERSLLLWLDSPSGPRLPHCRGFEITDTPESVGLLWTSDRPVAETAT